MGTDENHGLYARTSGRVRACVVFVRADMGRHCRSCRNKAGCFPCLPRLLLATVVLMSAGMAPDGAPLVNTDAEGGSSTAGLAAAAAALPGAGPHRHHHHSWPSAGVPRVTWAEVWDLIANETRSVVLGVQVSGADDGVFGRVAAAHAAASSRFRQEGGLECQADMQRGADNIHTATTTASSCSRNADEEVLFRVVTQRPPFLDRPAVLMFARAAPDPSCLVKPHLHLYPKQLEQCVRAT